MRMGKDTTDHGHITPLAIDAFTYPGYLTRMKIFAVYTLCTMHVTTPSELKVINMIKNDNNYNNTHSTGTQVSND